MHRLKDIDKEKAEGFCHGCNKTVDVYAYLSKGHTRYRCGPKAREYRREQYVAENPEARRYKKHGV